MPRAPDSLARELRAAVLAADHERAARLTEEYAEALSGEWMALSPEERTVSSLPKQSLELLTWVRDMTLMQQALAAQHLAFVERVQRNHTARSKYLQSAVAEA